MSNQVVAYSNATLEDRQKYAGSLAQASDLIPKGLWGHFKNPDTNAMEQRPSPGKILLVLETGDMLGLHPMAALQGIDVIEGKATVSPQTMSAIVRKAGHKLSKKQSGSIATGDLTVTWNLTRGDDETEWEAAWSLHDAHVAELGMLTKLQDGSYTFKAQSEKGNAKAWQKYTRNMLKWRSLGDLCREACPDVLLGVAYMPEELGATVDGDGEVIEGELEPSRDWQTAFTAAETVAEVQQLIREATAESEYSMDVKKYAMSRLGELNRAAEADEPEEAEDES